MHFIVFDRKTGKFLASKAKKVGLGGSLDERSKADYFSSEDGAMAEVKWLIDNYYLPSDGIYCALPKDSIILRNP